MPSAHSLQTASLSETIGQFYSWYLYRSSGRESPKILQNLLSMKILADHKLLSEEEENLLKGRIGKLCGKLGNNEVKFANLEREVKRLSDLEKSKHKIIFVARKLLEAARKFLPFHQREEWPAQQLKQVIDNVKEERTPCQEQRQLQELSQCLKEVQTSQECEPHLMDKVQKAVQNSHSNPSSSNSKV